jgi:hypothetical protein
MNRPTPLSGRASRRDALKIGGLAVSLGALAAACGNGRTGITEPGRVGNAPTVEPLDDFPIDNAALLRTATSLEYTAIEVYQRALDLDGAVPAALRPAMERMIEEHETTAEEMAELTVAVGGEPWTCANLWFMERLVEPVFAAIAQDAEPEAVTSDVLTFAIVFENFAAASHQELIVSVTDPTARQAHARAAALEARHSATLAIAMNGADGYISPALLGEDVTPDELGQVRQFAMPSTFAQTSQLELKAGPPDVNGVRETFTLNTPSLNSIAYNEISCDA